MLKYVPASVALRSKPQKGDSGFLQVFDPIGSKLCMRLKFLLFVFRNDSGFCAVTFG
jgi:hypothetical protein